MISSRKAQVCATISGAHPPKYPQTPYSRKMVDPSGHVRMVVLSTGRTIREEPLNVYGPQQLAEKRAKGWLLYSECPEPEGKRCAGVNPARPGQMWKYDTEAGRYVEPKCCEHIDAIIAERQASSQAREAEYAERFKTQQERLVKLIEAQAQQQIEQPRRK